MKIEVGKIYEMDRGGCCPSSFRLDKVDGDLVSIHNLRTKRTEQISLDAFKENAWLSWQQN